MRRVAITGIGAVTPLGVGAPTLHKRWAAGESGIEDGLARCSEFEVTDHLTRRQARRTDRFTHLALAAAAEAISQAGLDEAPYDRAEIGSVIGTGIGGLSTIEHEHTVLDEHGQGKVSPHWPSSTTCVVRASGPSQPARRVPTRSGRPPG
jgi:3-oxoacyl-[acyl-carrier-protein] synthase II